MNVRSLTEIVIAAVLVVLTVNAGEWLFKSHVATTEQVKRKPVIIIDQTPQTENVTLGDLYIVDILLEKTRDDCENGWITRQMFNVENGQWYPTEDFPATVLGVGVSNFEAEMKTAPLYKADAHKAKAGIFQVLTRIAYDCPEGKRDTTFRSPPFKMVVGK